MCTPARRKKVVTQFYGQVFEKSVCTSRFTTTVCVSSSDVNSHPSMLKMLQSFEIVKEAFNNLITDLADARKLYKVRFSAHD